MIFKWIKVPDFEHKRRKNPNDPIRSPSKLLIKFCLILFHQFFFSAMLGAFFGNFY